MNDIKPGDKFNIRHERKGDGQWVVFGPYECEQVMEFTNAAETEVFGYYAGIDNVRVIVGISRCVKVEDE